MESTVRRRTRIVPMAVPRPMSGSMRIVRKLFFLGFLQFLHLPMVILERFVNVMRSTDDWAEFDVVLLCDPSPTMTAGLQVRDLIESLARSRRQGICDEQSAVTKTRLVTLLCQCRNGHVRFARDRGQNAFLPAGSGTQSIEVARRSFEDDGLISPCDCRAQEEENCEGQIQILHTTDSQQILRLSLGDC